MYFLYISAFLGRKWRKGGSLGLVKVKGETKIAQTRK
jgi:hypothetical protein